MCALCTLWVRARVLWERQRQKENDGVWVAGILNPTIPQPPKLDVTYMDYVGNQIVGRGLTLPGVWPLPGPVSGPLSLLTVLTLTHWTTRHPHLLFQGTSCHLLP